MKTLRKVVGPVEALCQDNIDESSPIYRQPPRGLDALERALFARPGASGKHTVNIMIRKSLFGFTIPVAGDDDAGGDSGQQGAGSGSGSGTQNNAGGSQGSGSPPNAGTQSSKDTSSGSKQGGDDSDEKFDKAYVQELRREAAKHRKEREELATRLKALEDEKLTEQEKIAKKAAELEAENAKLKRDNWLASVERAANRAGAIHPDAIAKLVDDDAEDIEKAVAGVKKAYPQLFRAVAGSADGGQGKQSKGAGTESMNDWMRRSAGRGIQELT